MAGAEARLCSPCRILILDAALFADPANGDALARLNAAGDREFWLLADSEIAAAKDPSDAAFARVLSGGEDDAALSALARSLDESPAEAAEILLVTPRERLASWARQRDLAVINPAPGELATELSPAALVLRDAAALVTRAKRRREDRPCLIGINGIDKSGKSHFSERLGQQLSALGFDAQLLALDIFTAAKKQRQAKDYPEPERLYHKTYDMDRLRDQLLQPLRAGRDASLTLDVYDREKERLTGKRVVQADPSSLILLEGPFLFQEEIFSYFDYRIYLVTDFERALELELGDLSGKRRDKRQREFAERQLAAQSLYLRAETPWKRAHLVLRGVNGDRPRVEDWREEDRFGDESVSATVY